MCGICCIVIVVGMAHLGDEALPSRVIVPLAGVVGTGEAVVYRSLKRQEGSEISDPGVIPLWVRTILRGDGFLAGRVGVRAVWC
jgi:hypothetical protein